VPGGIAADELRTLGALGAQPVEETDQHGHISLFINSQRAFTTDIDVLHQCQVFMASSPLSIMHTNGFDTGQITVRQSLTDRHLGTIEYVIPTDPERLLLQPGHSARLFG
jgi:hypothetical protein